MDWLDWGLFIKPPSKISKDAKNLEFVKPLVWEKLSLNIHEMYSTLFITMLIQLL